MRYEGVLLFVSNPSQYPRSAIHICTHAHHNLTIASISHQRYILGAGEIALICYDMFCVVVAQWVMQALKVEAVVSLMTPKIQPPSYSAE